MTPLEWETLYRFLTREHLSWGTSWQDSKVNARLGGPLPEGKQRPLLFSRSTPCHAVRPGAPPVKTHSLRQPLLTGPAGWHFETDECDVRRVTVFMVWRAFCPRFAESSLWKRLFATAPAAPAEPARWRPPEQLCPFCDGRLAKLVARPGETFLTSEFYKTIMQPIHASVAKENLEDPPLYGSLASDDYTRDEDSSQLCVCSSGHFLHADQWHMIDVETRDAIAEDDDDDDDEDEDEDGSDGSGCGYGRRQRCAYARGRLTVTDDYYGDPRLW